MGVTIGDHVALSQLPLPLSSHTPTPPPEGNLGMHSGKGLLDEVPGCPCRSISVSQKAVQTLPPHCCPISAGLTGADALFASGISGNQVNRAGVVSEPPSIHATVLLPEGEFAWRWLSSWT